MLLSQRIAKDPSFLRFPAPLKGSKEAAFELRMKIVKATKMVVGVEFLDSERDPRKLNEQIFGHQPSQEETQKRLGLYERFSRLPFDLLFLENHTGGVLLEQLPDNTLCVYTVMGHGRSLFYRLTMRIVDNTFEAHTHWLLAEKDIKAHLGSQFEEYDRLRTDVAMFQLIEALEILLYINTKNVVKHFYTPTKRENQMVPKPLLPHYSYYVLDVFHDRKEYHSLQEIEQDHCVPKDTSQRRAGLVMGHFKQRATGLFWWSQHVRNNKNRETRGFVDKDYRLRHDQENSSPSGA